MVSLRCFVLFNILNHGHVFLLNVNDRKFTLLYNTSANISSVRMHCQSKIKCASLCVIKDCCKASFPKSNQLGVLTPKSLCSII